MTDVYPMYYQPKEAYRRTIMNHKKIIPFINAENEYPANVIQLANRYSCEGADELFLYNYSIY